MKKIFIMAFLMLTFAFHMSAQTDYRELLVRDDRTYWATAASLFDPIRHFSESGMWFDKNGEFERYYVSFENDTMTTKDYAYDIEVFVIPLFQMRHMGGAVPVVCLQLEPHPLAGERLPRRYVLGCQRPLGGKPITPSAIRI
jgi:hypothetical protein